MEEHLHLHVLRASRLVMFAKLVQFMLHIEANVDSILSKLFGLEENIRTMMLTLQDIDCCII